MWILFAFGSALFAGITSILAKCGIKDTDSDIVTALRTIVVLIFSWIMVLLTGSRAPVNGIEFGTMLFLFLSGLATGASWLCYFKALQMGDVNKVTPIDKSSTILTMLMAFLFLKEEITIIKAVAMVFISLGTYSMIQKKTSEHTQAKGHAWFFYACGSAVFASLTSILGKVGITNIDSNLGTAIRTFVVLIMAWLVVLLKGKLGEVKNITLKSWLFIGLSGCATGGSWFCYYRALQTGPASVIVPIDKLSILVTIAFAGIVFGERLSRKAKAGLTMVVGGTLMLLL
ncbi:EamA family transporter [Parablautia intestinalis]|uniref:EamA family transporter n=1 Tax=Parablautia intestinalis TaxID=2320100 RepID=UPI0023D3D338|nr:EamA family transporter [Parablautia intestinalis]MDE7048128.1 EamA family transporter [Lachnospiraceae bacterium]